MHACLVTKFTMKLFLVRSAVEIQIPAKNLIGTFTGDNHLHSQWLDFPRHEEHWNACSDCCNIICFDVVDYILNRINTVLSVVKKFSKKHGNLARKHWFLVSIYLDSEVELMVDSSKISGNVLSSLQVRRTLEKKLNQLISKTTWIIGSKS